MDSRSIAIWLWTFVHGVALLVIYGDYDVVVADLDVEAMIAESAPHLLG